MARFDSARAIAPDDAEAHRRYVDLASYFALNDEAFPAWDRVLELEPEEAEAWDGYLFDLRWAATYEWDRRYGVELLRVRPDAMRFTCGQLVPVRECTGGGAGSPETTKPCRVLLREHLG